jgi:hypothetical protein
MNALLDELQRYAGRRRRWTVRSGIAALLVGAAGVGLVAAASKSPDDPCTPNVPDDAWAPTARARVDAALDDASRPTVLSALDAHVARWRVVQHDLCATTWLRGERSPEALGAKLRCLHASWADLRQSVVLLSSGGVPRPVDVVEGVAAPETCRAVEVEPGGAPVDTQRFGELVDVVARAGALRRAGRPADAVVELRARVHEIRELGSAALLAEALLGLGRLEDDRDTARHLLDEALALARRSGHVRIEAETWIALATVAAHPEHARFCAQMGLAALTTVGNDPALEAEALGILEGL